MAVKCLFLIRLMFYLDKQWLDVFTWWNVRAIIDFYSGINWLHVKIVHFRYSTCMHFAVMRKTAVYSFKTSQMHSNEIQWYTVESYSNHCSMKDKTDSCIYSCIWVALVGDFVTESQIVVYKTQTPHTKQTTQTNCLYFDVIIHWKLIRLVYSSWMYVLCRSCL